MPTDDGDDGDPVIWAVIAALLVCGLVASADLAVDGALEPGVLALLVAVLGPIVPVFVNRYTRRDD